MNGQRQNNSWWIVFLDEGGENIIGRHIKFGGRYYDDALECAIRHMESKEYKEAKYFQILTEEEYNNNFK